MTQNELRYKMQTRAAVDEALRVYLSPPKPLPRTPVSRARHAMAHAIEAAYLEATRDES